MVVSIFCLYLSCNNDLTIKNNDMKISLINEKEQHLTATEKRAIKAILDAGLTEGRVGRTDYFITLEDDIYTVKISKNERGIGYGTALIKRTNTVKFKIN